jgi:hypothetical protein
MIFGIISRQIIYLRCIGYIVNTGNDVTGRVAGVGGGANLHYLSQGKIMDIIATRELINLVKKKFGDDAYLELFTDGSGRILVQYCPVIEFDGLGELAEILCVK